MKPEDIEVRAGVEGHFKKFGIINTIDALANGDILKWEKVEMLTYSMVFVKLCIHKENVLYQRKIRRLKQEEANKNQRKKN